MHGEVRVVDDVAQAFADEVERRAPRRIALSGGDTAHRAYAALAERDLDWSQIEVFIGDERFVPVDHPDSNEGKARELLLHRMQPKLIHSLADAAETIEEAALAYDELLSKTPPLDIIHLGLGEDGHTASLFPDDPGAMAETDRQVIPTSSPNHPHPRLSVTMPYINRNALALFTVDGQGKREIFQRIRDGEDLPAGQVQAQETLWLVGREVADA